MIDFVFKISSNKHITCLVTQTLNAILKLKSLIFNNLLLYTINEASSFHRCRIAVSKIYSIVKHHKTLKNK